MPKTGLKLPSRSVQEKLRMLVSCLSGVKNLAEKIKAPLLCGPRTIRVEERDS